MRHRYHIDSIDLNINDQKRKKKKKKISLPEHNHSVWEQLCRHCCSSRYCREIVTQETRDSVERVCRPLELSRGRRRRWTNALPLEPRRTKPKPFFPRWRTIVLGVFFSSLLINAERTSRLITIRSSNIDNRISTKQIDDDWLTNDTNVLNMSWWKPSFSLFTSSLNKSFFTNTED